MAEKDLPTRIQQREERENEDLRLKTWREELHFPGRSMILPPGDTLDMTPPGAGCPAPQSASSKWFHRRGARGFDTSSCTTAFSMVVLRSLGVMDTAATSTQRLGISHIGLSGMAESDMQSSREKSSQDLT